MEVLFCITLMAPSNVHNKIDKGKLIELYKYPPKHISNPNLEHISEGASSWTDNLYQDHMLDFLLKQLTQQYSEMKHWSFLSDCIPYTMTALPQCQEMIVSPSEIKHMTITFIIKNSSHLSYLMAKSVTTSKVTRDDF